VTPHAAKLLTKIRDAGWSVAVHNDYRLNGAAHTFWLFTHPNGRYLKGEGKSDEMALASVHQSIAQTNGDAYGIARLVCCPQCGFSRVWEPANSVGANFAAMRCTGCGTSYDTDNGLVIGFHDESVFSSGPAYVSVTHKGRAVAMIPAVIDHQQGADGGMYPCVVFKPVNET
jgi:hypothetical protein